MLSYKRAWLAAPLLVLSLTAVHAAEPATASKKALVQKMLQMLQPGVEGIARSLVEQPVAPMMQQVTGVLRNQVPADKRDALYADIQVDLKKYTDEAVPLLRDRANALAPSTIGVLLEQKFSEDELKQLVAWQESPLARKYQSSFPEFQRALYEKLAAETRPLIEPKLRTLNESITRRLSVLAPASVGATPTKP